jgi:hypothetical protein
VQEAVRIRCRLALGLPAAEFHLAGAQQAERCDARHSRNDELVELSHDAVPTVEVYP